MTKQEEIEKLERLLSKKEINLIDKLKYMDKFDKKKIYEIYCEECFLCGEEYDGISCISKKNFYEKYIKIYDIANSK